MRLRRILAIGASGAAMMIATAAPASASTDGWHHYEYGPYTETAGTDCSFTLHVVPVSQDVRYRTTDTYPNGDPKDQVWTGPLYERYINEDTGKSLVGNESGSAVIHYEPDATQDWYVVGPFGVTFNVGNPYHQPGEYIISGLTVMILHQGTVRQIAFQDGPIQDICAELS